MNIKKINWYMVILHVFLVVLAVQVLYLAKQNRDMRAMMRPSTMPSLDVGEEVAPVAVQEVDGAKQTLSFNGAEKETLLFVFNTTCPACRANQTNWKQLYQAAQGRYNIVGVSLHSEEQTRAYIQEHELPFRVVMPDDIESFAGAYKIGAIPQTIHLDRQGKVLEVKVGALTEENLTELSKAAL